MTCNGTAKELSGSDPATTNNRMELMAAISRPLAALTRPTVATVQTDSQYVIKGITEWLPSWKARGWRTGGSQAGQEPGPVGAAGSARRPAHAALAVGEGSQRGSGQRARR